MIRKITCSNFYSFKEKQEISFLAQKKKSLTYFNSESGDQITKIAGFVGSNAAGKTNVIRLLSFVTHFVLSSSKTENQEVHDVAFKTFFNNNKQSTFSIDVETDNKIYSYSFKVKSNVVVAEKLECKELKKYARFQQVFSRSEHEISINSELLKGINKELLGKIRKDISLVAYLQSHYDLNFIKEFYDYFNTVACNLTERGQILSRSHRMNVLRKYSDNSELKEQMEYFVRNFDLGLEGFEIKKQSIDTGIAYSVRGIHKTKEQNNLIDFRYESRGTQVLFFTLASILYAINNNGVAVIDEIELGLHPEALHKLLQYFIIQASENSAQLIFSSNALDFMKRFDMHQTYLVEKNNNGESTVLRLNEIENIRSDENHQAKYLAGAYGAFPEINL